jgi:hypothetical protein
VGILPTAIQASLQDEEEPKEWGEGHFLQKFSEQMEIA